MREKILVIKLWAIGEAALSTPCISRLKSHLPEADIYFLIGNNAKDIVIGNPNIMKVFSVDENIFLKPDLMRLVSLIVHLRKERFDKAIILHHSPFFSLFTFLIGAPERVGLKRPGAWSLNTANIVSNRTSIHKIFENLRVLELLSIYPKRDMIAKVEIYPTDEDKKYIKSLMEEHGLKARGFIILSPTGGENPAASRFNLNVKNKVWPVEYYRELAGLILSRTNFKIAIVGAIAERERAAHIKRLNPDRIIDLTGKMNLRELMPLADECAISITNDSGPMSVLSASASPLIAIFGPTDPRLICPVSDNVTIMREVLDCSPCFDGSTFPSRIKDCRDAICMRAVTPERVFQKISELLTHKGL